MNLVDLRDCTANVPNGIHQRTTKVSGGNLASASAVRRIHREGRGCGVEGSGVRPDKIPDPNLYKIYMRVN
jgi:hypothetical protein